jgi:cytochrome c
MRGLLITTTLALCVSTGWTHGFGGKGHSHGPSLPGDAVRGKAVYESKCVACHSVAENRVGPKHQGVFGRRAGSAKDYEYSDALKSSRVIWNRDSLTRWLTDPEQTIAGQRMGYRLGDAKEREDIIAYLATLK